MNVYYTAESEKFQQNIRWHACNAASLRSAKTIARRRKFFQSTAVHVGVQAPDGIVRIASWYPSSDVQAGWNDWQS